MPRAFWDRGESTLRMEAENVPEKVDDPEQSVSGTHPGKSPVVASPLDSSHAGQRPGDALEIRD